jgi:hypothetical protein
MACEGLEGVGGPRSPGRDCEDPSRRGVNIGAGTGVRMLILEANLVVMSGRRAANRAESLKMI